MGAINIYFLLVLVILSTNNVTIPLGVWMAAWLLFIITVFGKVLALDGGKDAE